MGVNLGYSPPGDLKGYRLLTECDGRRTEDQDLMPSIELEILDLTHVHIEGSRGIESTLKTSCGLEAQAEIREQEFTLGVVFSRARELSKFVDNDSLIRLEIWLYLGLSSALGEESLEAAMDSPGAMTAKSVRATSSSDSEKHIELRVGDLGDLIDPNLYFIGAN
jgi:hypothetical protein